MYFFGPRGTAVLDFEERHGLTDRSTSSTNVEWRPGLALASWLLPGLGHILGGERRRGAILMAAILGLFGVGLLIGGVGVIDARQQRLWFAGQALVGPITPALNYVHQSLKRKLDAMTIEAAAELPAERRQPRQISRITVDRERNRRYQTPIRQWDQAGLQRLLVRDETTVPYRRSIGRTAELGTLYCAMAGLLNLLVIIDVGVRPATRDERAASRPPGRLVTREDA